MEVIRAGIDISTSADPRDDPVSAAISAESLGFDFVSCSDHPSGRHPSYETWTLLTTVAARTSRVGLLTRVLSVPFRPPALVAKMAESLNRLSGGRLLLGLGAGAALDEMRAFGVPALRAGERVAGLADAVRILKGLWTEESFSYDGPVHHVVEAPMEPKPARAIPIWLGTFGDRALAVTGELADGWIPSLGYVAPGDLPRMRARVLEAAERAGRRPGDITCVLNTDVRVERDADSAPDRVVGPPEMIVERLAAFVEAGFSAFNFLPLAPSTPDQVETLASTVVPALRSLGSAVRTAG